MESIYIEATNDSPSVFLDPKNFVIKIEGASFPENADDVYDKISQWIDDIAPHLDSVLVVSFYYSYINSASKKKVYDMLLQLEQISEKGNKIVVKWLYDAYDEDMKELGQELNDLVLIPFQYKSIKSNI